MAPNFSTEVLDLAYIDRLAVALLSSLIGRHNLMHEIQKRIHSLETSPIYWRSPLLFKQHPISQNSSRHDLALSAGEWKVVFLDVELSVPLDYDSSKNKCTIFLRFGALLARESSASDDNCEEGGVDSISTDYAFAKSSHLSMTCLQRHLDSAGMDSSTAPSVVGESMAGALRGLSAGLTAKIVGNEKLVLPLHYSDLQETAPLQLDISNRNKDDVRASFRIPSDVAESMVYFTIVRNSPPLQTQKECGKKHEADECNIIALLTTWHSALTKSTEFAESTRGNFIETDLKSQPRKRSTILQPPTSVEDIETPQRPGVDPHSETNKKLAKYNCVQTQVRIRKRPIAMQRRGSRRRLNKEGLQYKRPACSEVEQLESTYPSFHDTAAPIKE